MVDHSDGMDGATSAFVADLGGKPSSSKSASADGVQESLFDNTGDDDEEDDAGPEDEQDIDEGGDDDGEDGDAEESDGDEEDESEEDESDEADEADAQGPDLKAIVKLTVDGEELEVPLEEALQGYIRTETFHKRLNLLNEAKTIIERERGEVSVSREQYLTGLNVLVQQLDELTPKEPNWDELYAADPANARQLEVKWSEFKKQRATLDAERTRVATEQNAERTRNLHNYVQAEQVKVLQAVPEWHDPKAREKDSASMLRTGKAAGFTDKELAEVYDHRMVVILRKAAAYDRITAKKPVPTKVVNKTPVTPGSGNSARSTVQKGGDRAMKQLSRTGKLSDATNVFAKFIR